MTAHLTGALAAIIADPDCCAASKAIARDALAASGKAHNPLVSDFAHTPGRVAIESAVKAYHAFAIKRSGSTEFYPYGILLAVEAAFASSGSELFEVLERLYEHSVPTGPVGDDARAKAFELIQAAKGGQS